MSAAADPTLLHCASCQKPGRVFAVVVTRSGEASICPKCYVTKPSVVTAKRPRKR